MGAAAYMPVTFCEHFNPANVWIVTRLDRTDHNKLLDEHEPPAKQRRIAIWKRP